MWTWEVHEASEAPFSHKNKHKEREREREREMIYINGGYEIWTIRKVFIYSGGGLELGTKCGVKFDYGCRPDWK
jgi:hypothetical protein